MLAQYLAAAMRHARYEILKDNGTFPKMQPPNKYENSRQSHISHGGSYAFSGWLVQCS